MKTKLISAAVVAVLAGWGPLASAQQTIVITPPYTFGPNPADATGQLSGIRTTGPGTLNVNPGINVNTSGNLGGGITTDVANLASIVFSGSSTVTGFTGAAGNTFLNIGAGANGSTVNFNGAVFSTTFNVTGTGTVNFNGGLNGAPNFAADGFINLGAGQTIIGAIITATANTGTLTLNGGSSVIGAIGGANGLKMINVVGGNATVTGAVQAGGFNLGANTLGITGALTTNAGATIATTIASNSVFGRINPTGASNINPGGITVIPTVTGPLTVGTNFRIVNGLAGPALVPVSVINNSPLFTFTGVPTTTGDVNILLTAAVPVAAVLAAPAAVALGSVVAAPGSDLAAVQGAIFAAPTVAGLNNALAQLSPNASSLAAPWVAGQATRLFEDLWMTRVDEIQNKCCDTCEPGKSAPSVNLNNCRANERGSWWGKVFDNTARQGDRGTASGYRTEALGLMVAYEKPLNSQTRAGLGGGYANTSIDANNVGGSTNVDSYQMTAYVSHAPGPWYVQGAVTAGRDKYSGTRPISLPGISRVATANYSGEQYTALVSTGRHYYLSPSSIVTPLASLQVSRMHVGGYSESGAGDINLRANDQDYNFVQSTVGVKAERLVSTLHGTYSPEVHAKWLHDFSSTTMQQNATLAGGGAAFDTRGITQDRELFNVGAGITFLSCKCGADTWTVKALYDYKWNQSAYSSHQIGLIASLKL